MWCVYVEREVERDRINVHDEESYVCMCREMWREREFIFARICVVCECGKIEVER